MPGLFLYPIDSHDAGIKGLCAGLESAHRGAVVRIAQPDWAGLRSELRARLAVQAQVAVLATWAPCWRSPCTAPGTRAASARAGLELPIAAFGFSAGLVRAVLDGSVLFTILDHPELQAYLSAAAALIAERWRLDPAAYFDGAALLIRPQIADAAYMQRLVDTLYAE